MQYICSFWDFVHWRVNTENTWLSDLHDKCVTKHKDTKHKDNFTEEYLALLIFKQRLDCFKNNNNLTSSFLFEIDACK